MALGTRARGSINGRLYFAGYKGDVGNLVVRLLFRNVGIICKNGEADCSSGVNGTISASYCNFILFLFGSCGVILLTYRCGDEIL